MPAELDEHKFYSKEVQKGRKKTLGFQLPENYYKPNGVVWLPRKSNVLYLVPINENRTSRKKLGDSPRGAGWSLLESLLDPTHLPQCSTPRRCSLGSKHSHALLWVGQSDIWVSGLCSLCAEFKCDKLVFELRAERQYPGKEGEQWLGVRVPEMGAAPGSILILWWGSIPFSFLSIFN